MSQEDKDGFYDEKMNETSKDGHILNSLDDVKVYDIPPYSLTVSADNVKEIKLPKPLGKIFWNNLI